MNIPKTIAVADALLDGIAQIDSTHIPGIVDKMRGAIHFAGHADDAFISEADKLDAQRIHDVLVSDILEMFAKRGIPVR